MAYLNDEQLIAISHIPDDKTWTAEGAVPSLTACWNYALYGGNGQAGDHRTCPGVLDELVWWKRNGRQTPPKNKRLKTCKTENGYAGIST